MSGTTLFQGSNTARAQAYRRPLTPNRSRSLTLYEIYEWPQISHTNKTGCQSIHSGISLARAGNALIYAGNRVY